MYSIAISIVFTCFICFWLFLCKWIMNRPPIATHCHPLPGASVAREFAALKIATSLLKSRCISTARISETLRLLALLLAKEMKKW